MGEWRWMLLAGVLVAGCASVGAPERSTSSVEIPARFSGGNGATEEPPPERWWTALNDADLDALIERSLADNLDLRATWSRLEQARAIVVRDGAATSPTLDLRAGASRTEVSTARGRDSSALSLGLAAGYEIDLWGRVSATRDAAAYDVAASEHDLRTSALSLSAEVASSWYRLLAVREEAALVRSQLETNADQLKTIGLRFRLGFVPAVDVVQQQQLLERARGDLELIEADAAVELHRLAVLVGAVPGAFRAPDGSLPRSVTGGPETSAPAAWLHHRPDLAAAWLRVHAAHERTAAALADRFPRISLSAGADVTSDSLRDLFDNWLANVAANLVAPLIDGDRRDAEADRNAAVAAQRVHEYGQLLLRSIEEVENALVLESRRARNLASVEEQFVLSRRAVTQTVDRYKKGTFEFTRFLTTTLAHQQLERSLVRARRDVILARVGLFRSLGRGVTPPKPEDDGDRDDD